MQNIVIYCSKFLGIQAKTQLHEKYICACGGFLSIFIIFYISYLTTNLQGASAISTSMGAATVLLFTAPKAEFSQPWALFAGNVISAFIGVCCYLYFTNIFLAASLAVGIAILAMIMFRCNHPPGGATALAAVIGGDAVHQLGFYYMVMPTLLNCAVIFVVAMLFNNIFGWRRYPAKLNSEQLFTTDLPILVGEYYSNNRLSIAWSIRKVTQIYLHAELGDCMVVYQVITGKGQVKSDSCSMLEFSHWATNKISDN